MAEPAREGAGGIRARLNDLPDRIDRVEYLARMLPIILGRVGRRPGRRGG